MQFRIIVYNDEIIQIDKQKRRHVCSKYIYQCSKPSVFAGI